jgi:hypothetical protein
VTAHYFVVRVQASKQNESTHVDELQLTLGAQLIRLASRNLGHVILTSDLDLYYTYLFDIPFISLEHIILT